MIHVYIGEEGPYLLSLVRKEVNNILKEDKNDFNFASFDMLNSSLSDVIEEAQNVSFLSDTKVVVLNNANFLTGEGKVNQKELEKFEKYIKNPNPMTELFLISIGKLESEKKNKIVALLKESSVINVIDKLTKDDLINMGMRYVGLKNCEIDRESIEEIYLRVKGDYQTFFNTLDKLMTYTSKIRMCDVELLVIKPLEDNIFGIIELLFKNDVAKAMNLYKDLNKNGQDAIKLLPIFASQLRFMYLVSTLIASNKQDYEIAKELNCNPYRVKFARKSVVSISPNTILEIMSDLYELERHVKFDLDDASMQMELFIVNFRNKYLRRKAL